MALITKPVRVLETDAVALKMVAAIESRSPAQVVHAALREYLEKHRDELQAIFTRTQRAIAAGDEEALVLLLRESADDQIDALVADVDSYRQ